MKKLSFLFGSFGCDSEHSSRTRGFTLIELLVVIAIIGLLSSIVFASLSGARVRGRIAAAQGSMKNLITSAVLCWDDAKTVQLPTESNNGGLASVCNETSITATKYGALPTNWNYCDGDNTTTSFCDSPELSVASPPTLIAKGDSKKITCDQNGCVTK